MIEQGDFREIVPKPWDREIVSREALISEEKIVIFCYGCDFLGKNNICQLGKEGSGARDQARYAERGWCG